jgi:hypothetical protein
MDPRDMDKKGESFWEMTHFRYIGSGGGVWCLCEYFDELSLCFVICDFVGYANIISICDVFRRAKYTSSPNSCSLGAI